MSDNKTTLDFREFRERIGDIRGKEYWRSLEDLSRGADFEELLQEEFPRQSAPLANGVHRRDFMKLMSASIALAGAASCTAPSGNSEKIVPYVRQPEDLIPGKPLFFATAMPLAGYTTGVLAESHMGRPTKIEGNPDHPSSLGGTDAYMQASILGLYDPDRSQVVRTFGETRTWSDFIGALQPVLKEAAVNGAGLRLLTQTITSPTLGAAIAKLVAQYPGMQWHQWEPVSGDNAREGLRAAFGGYVNAVYHFDKANVVVTLDSDFMSDGPGHVRYSRDFSTRRRVRHGETKSINRMYAIESSPTSTGSIADHRLPVRPSQIEGYARAIAAGLGIAAAGATTEHADWIGGVVRDLQRNHGAAVVVAGDDQPPAVHQLAMAINQAIGAIGTTVSITDSAEVSPVNQLESLRRLVTDMNAGAVKALIMFGGNPIFDAPADFNFRSAFEKVPFRAHLSLYYDETSMLSHWHIPETHYLETWGDGRGHDGTITIQQPLIAPLYNGRSAIEVIGAMAGGMDQSPYDAVRAYWMANGANELLWRKWLNDGVIANSALPARSASASTAIPAPAAQPSGGFELRIAHDPNIYDGRFANNGWLQELPKPQTKITWENVLLLSPKSANDIGFGDQERDDLFNEKHTLLADLTFHGRTIRVPVWVVPGMPDNVATIHFGYGRKHGGKIAAERSDFTPGGVDVYPIRFSDALHGGAGAQIKLVRSEGTYPIGCTQEHQSINPKDVGGDRGIIRSATFDEYQRNPHFVQGEGEGHEGTGETAEADASMYPKYEYPGHAWAMVIDTSVCTGCNGCVIACQSENNISIVGKEEVVREREMHWLRIDRYYKGSPENPEVYHQPVPCMQCENAPCEPVCPVEATSHSGEGLNDMTYNRCVGTRYCSNNCPYKVRRFNFFHYADYDTPSLKPMRNPDVTVRTRGVMEKCTYCVQRINAAKIAAEIDGEKGRRVRDGEVTTACQQACPSEAITFGDMNDPTSRVAALKKEPANYALLQDLNTRPRTTYLGAIRNPNPEIRG